MEVKPLTAEEEDRARSWLNGRGTVQIPELVASLFATLDAERALRVEAERHIVHLIDVCQHAGGRDWTAVQDAAAWLKAHRALDAEAIAKGVKP